MPTKQAYELVDFGDGRRLERFDGVLLDRPSPAAVGSKARPTTWDQFTAKFQGKGQTGRWEIQAQTCNPWEIQLEQTRFELRLTESGQIGVFPEQARNWRWIRGRLKGHHRARVLNLFAYTGGSTIAAALAGAEVVHVDAAASVVRWARKNARLSGLESAPIRWIVEDAAKFVHREIKRGNKYDGIVLDPPSYGQGPKGETWKLKRDLLGLLTNCRLLLAESPKLFLLSCHTPGFGPAELSAMVCECLFGNCAATVRGKELTLATSDDRRLSVGYVASWP